MLRIGAAAIRRGTPAARATPLRKFSAPSHTEGELAVLARVSKFEGEAFKRVDSVRKKIIDVREKQAKILNDFGISTNKEAVKESAGVSVLFVSGLVAMGLATFYNIRNAGSSKEVEDLTKRNEDVTKRVNDVAKREEDLTKK